jgi:hypothetical protein
MRVVAREPLVDGFATRTGALGRKDDPVLGGVYGEGEEMRVDGVGLGRTKLPELLALEGAETEREDDRVDGAGLGREELPEEKLPRLEAEREPVEMEAEGRLRLVEEERP